MSSHTTGVAPERLIVTSPPEFAGAAATLIAEEIERAIGTLGRCSIALTGGETVIPVYEHLARAPLRDRIDWSAMDVYWGDERCVPPDHPHSNYGLGYESLLALVTVPPEQIHRMECEAPDRDGAARQYADLLPERLDILLLGVGADGHTCSLFPSDPALDERDARVVAVHGGDPELPRLTITPPVIADARRVITMVTGEVKAHTVARVLEGPISTSELPAQLALGGIWILDDPAAGELRELRRT